LAGGMVAQEIPDTAEAQNFQSKPQMRMIIAAARNQSDTAMASAGGGDMALALRSPPRILKANQAGGSYIRVQFLRSLSQMQLKLMRV
jgi:hypothetical protein